MASKKNSVKWERAKLLKRRDTIIGSPQFKDLPAFNASYEAGDEVSIQYLLSWKYGRVWRKEFGDWISKFFIAPDKGVYRRKYVVRASKKNSTK